MTEINRVEAYFSSVAKNYQQASKGRLWNGLRQREAQALLRACGELRGHDILELGCGAGYYTRLLLAEGARHVWAVDLSHSMLQQLPSSGVTPLQSDATTVDPGRTFDVLVSAGMLEFVPDPGAVLQHAAKLANPAARLLVLLPTRSVLGRLYRRFHRGHGLDIGLFDRTRLEQLASASGWTVARYVPAGPYSAVASLERRAL